MSKERHKVIVIPGLGDHRSKPLEWATNHWNRKGLEPIVYPVGWHDGELFEPKLLRLTQMVDEIVEDGDKVSVAGVSAGGCMAVNVSIERPHLVHRTAAVCSRLRVGPTQGFRSFAAKTASSPSFAESVQWCESNLGLLTPEEIQKIMTVTAQFGDELVPRETSIIEGAYNTTVPTAEHMFSIGAALTAFSPPLIAFLKQETHE